MIFLKIVIVRETPLTLKKFYLFLEALAPSCDKFDHDFPSGDALEGLNYFRSPVQHKNKLPPHVLGQ